MQVTLKLNDPGTVATVRWCGAAIIREEVSHICMAENRKINTFNFLFNQENIHFELFSKNPSVEWQNDS